MNEVLKSFLLFIMYSFCGWLLEVVNVSIKSKKVCDRGFLIGPICPIYGISSLIMILLLNKYKHDYLVLFFMSMMICSIIEYITSYIMEKLFKTRWWDYSKNKFNLNGRVCLKNSVLFGILGIIVVAYINPLFLDLLNKINYNTQNYIGIVLLVLFILDVSISLNIINKVKVAADNLRKDCTEEIHEKIKTFIKSKSFLYKRLFKAFPNLKVNIKIGNNKKGIK